jgi:hypothetical protein
MSRFFQTNSERTRHLPVTVPAHPLISSKPATVQPASPPATAVAAGRTSFVDEAGVLALGLYLIAGLATDLTLRLIGSKSYVSTVAGLVVLAAFLVSGKALRSLNYRAGQLWLFLTVWLMLAILTSRWPGGSFTLLRNYIPKLHFLLFYVVAFSVTIRQCRTLFYANIIGGFVILLSCFAFGRLSPTDARLSIPDSIMFDNPNDLALALVVTMGYFVYLVSQHGPLKRAAGAVGIAIAFYYLIKTGSRGSLIACLGFYAVYLLMSKHRLRILACTLPVAFLTLFLVPRESIDRLSLVFKSAREVTRGDSVEESALASEMQRRDLLVASLRYMFISRPVFGVGPGQFNDAYWEDSKAKGKHVASLGTHNTYTQFGSESGLPAMIAYIAVIVIGIRTNYRAYRSLDGHKTPDGRELATMSLALLMTTLAFAINILFHHVGYTGYLPVMAGLTISVSALANQLTRPAPGSDNCSRSRPRSLPVGGVR